MDDERMTYTPEDILLLRYLEGSCTETEERKVERWLQEQPANADRFERLVQEHSDRLNVPVDTVKAKLLSDVEEPGLKKIKTESYPSPGSTGRPDSRHRWFAGAAVVLLALAVSAGIYIMLLNNSVQTEVAYVERSMPAGKVATLTLSDGTRVQLNSSSTLRYPEPFSSSAREVELEGEAFFEVVSDKDRPFKVQAGDMRTTVLGTAFNIKAFPGDQQAQVTVAEGMVAVDISNEADFPRRVVLEPNQWVIYDGREHNLQRGRGDIRELIAWKDGMLLFNNKSFVDVIDMLERWYGTDIIFENKALADCVLHGEHEDETLENVLEAIKFALGINYTLTNEKVIIRGGGCK